MALIVRSHLADPSEPSTAVRLSSKPAFRVYVHNDVVQWMNDFSHSDPTARKVKFDLQSLMSRGFAPKSKGVVGPLRGWRRAPLGGNSGSHFYLWYVPAGTEIGRALDLPEDAVAVRARRHHDDFAGIDPGSLSTDYFEFTPQDLDVSDQDSGPYTPEQLRIATSARAAITLLLGYPGSGKTTSLLLSALHSNVGKLLYVTYSERLAREAAQFFATFRPADSEIEVMTFRELVEVVDNLETPSVRSSAELARSLNERLSARPNLLRFFAEHPDELYAELHAHALGRALPIDFDGIDASSDGFMSDYERHRADDLGQGISRNVTQIIEFMRQHHLADEFFAPLTRARRAIADVNSPPPPRLRGASMILVDEVQDLTQVEALLLLNVCARVAVDNGQVPRIVLAGDESQTVRPTDFRWSWLKNLATEIFGRDTSSAEENLTVNLRSPLQIARFVEATRSQYAKFEKSDRPRGMTYTETSDAFLGRVMYCVAHDDSGMQKILEAFAEIPRSCIVYPGFVAPPELTATELGAELISSSEGVKGLDFNVVGLLDAGARQVDLDALLARRLQDPYVDAFGRTLADQYRVAASRAAETLVLIDRNGADHTEQIRSLCRQRREEIELELVEVDDLSMLLHHEVDQEELIRSWISEVETLMEVEVERAILRSASLVKQMDRLKRTAEHDSTLEPAVLRIRALALLAGLLHDGPLPRLDKDDIRAEVSRLAQQVSLGNEFEDVLELAIAPSSWADIRRLERIERALGSLEGVRRSIPEVFRRHEARILQWHDRLPQSEVPSDQAKRLRVLDVARQVTEALRKSHDYLVGQEDAVRSAWAEQLIPKRAYEESLALLKGRRTPDHPMEARCLQLLRRWAAAADSFELASMPSEAIDCLRQIPDPDRALGLAEKHAIDLTDTLRWLVSARSHLTEARPPGSAELTDAETADLVRWAKAAKRSR